MRVKNWLYKVVRRDYLTISDCILIFAIGVLYIIATPFMLLGFLIDQMYKIGDIRVMRLRNGKTK